MSNECNGERQARKEARETLYVEEGKIRFLSFLLFIYEMSCAGVGGARFQIS
jgi:hypothetical protein